MSTTSAKIDTQTAAERNLCITWCCPCSSIEKKIVATFFCSLFYKYYKFGGKSSVKTKVVDHKKNGNSVFCAGSSTRRFLNHIVIDTSIYFGDSQVGGRNKSSFVPFSLQVLCRFFVTVDCNTKNQNHDSKKTAARFV